MGGNAKWTMNKHFATKKADVSQRLPFSSLR
nr:MAG TPA: hypothetical protein [Caudoviricetes sp.]